MRTNGLNKYVWMLVEQWLNVADVFMCVLADKGVVSSTEKIHYFLQIYILVETHLNLLVINYYIE